MVQIPDDRRYFRIGDASRILGVEPYVLRYWENEFPQLRPGRASSRHRTYQKKDLELVLEIKKLLYEQKMTIEGAKRCLRNKETAARASQTGLLEEIKSELDQVVQLLT
jgi:DNA-binding transcriptional MerR regulator